jgi:tetratricopeptide (TPR) repeat protein
MTETDKLKYVKTSSNEKTLDQTLDELDSLIGKLDAKNKGIAIQILGLMDEVHNRFSDQIKFDNEGKPQNSQLGYLYKQIRKQAAVIVKAAGGESWFQKQRKETAFPEKAWWWYLDVYLAQKRKKSLLTMVRGFIIFAVIVAGIVLAYQKWFAPPPEVRARLGYENQASLAIEDGRYEDALYAVNEALTYGPEQYSLWIQKGMLLLKLGDEDAAQKSFDQALALGIDMERYYIERVYNAMQFGMIDLAQEDINQLLKVNPESAEGYLFRGQILESEGDTIGAIQAYEKASQYAEQQEKIELMTTIRMRLGMLMQSAGLPTMGK